MKNLRLKNIEEAKRGEELKPKNVSYLYQWHDPRFITWVNNQDVISFKNKVYLLFLLCQSVYLVAKGVITPKALKAIVYIASKTVLIKDGVQWKILSQRSSYVHCDVFRSCTSASYAFKECTDLGLIKRVSSGQQSYAHAVDFYQLRSLLYNNGIETKFDNKFLDKESNDYELNYETVCRLFYQNISNLLEHFNTSRLRIALFVFKECILNKKWVDVSSFWRIGQEINLSCHSVIENIQNLRNLQVLDVRDGVKKSKHFVFAPGDTYLSENNQILMAGEAYKKCLSRKETSLEKAILSLNCSENSNSWDFSDYSFIKKLQERGECFYRNQSSLGVYGDTSDLAGKYDKALGAYAYLAASNSRDVLEVIVEWCKQAYPFTKEDDVKKLSKVIKDGLVNYIDSNWYERKSILFNLDKKIAMAFDLDQVHIVSQVGYKILCDIYLERGLIVDNFSLIDENLSKLSEAFEYHKQNDEQKKLSFLNKKSCNSSKVGYNENRLGG